MTLPTPGTPAPDFTLPSTSGSPVTLASLTGRNVLLAFFPLAFTGTCTAELCAFSEDYRQFRDQNTEVLPISVDSIPTLKEFKARERMTIDLLSDFKREVCRLYGTLNEERFFANRAYILIDRDGVVRWGYVEEQNGSRRDNAELLSRIRAMT